MRVGPALLLAVHGRSGEKVREREVGVGVARSLLGHSMLPACGQELPLWPRLVEGRNTGVSTPRPMAQVCSTLPGPALQRPPVLR